MEEDPKVLLTTGLSLPPGQCYKRVAWGPDGHIAAACDRMLPWHWRCQCLDQAWRPLRDLEKLSHCACRLKRWQTFAWQLATCELQPSISHSDLVQGSSDE